MPSILQAFAAECVGRSLPSHKWVRLGRGESRVLMRVRLPLGTNLEHYEYVLCVFESSRGYSRICGYIVCLGGDVHHYDGKREIHLLCWPEGRLFSF